MLGYFNCKLKYQSHYLAFAFLTIVSSTMFTTPAHIPLCMFLSTLQQFTAEVVSELFINDVHQDCMAVMQSAD